MKKYIIGIVAFVGVLVLCVVAYGYLSKNYNTVDTEFQDFSSSSDSSSNKTKAVDFTVTNIDGNEVKLSDYYGKPIVINFWATWCGPCKYEIPAFEKAYNEYGEKIEFLMVNLTDGSRDTVSGVKKFVASGGYNFPVYFDTKFSVANAYRISSIPMTAFISTDGTISETYTGALSESVLISKLEKLLK